MTTLWLIILGGFLVATDYTVQKTGIDWDFTHDPKMRTEVIYYDRIDSVGYDGLYFFTPDSVVNHYKGKKEVRWE